MILSMKLIKNECHNEPDPAGKVLQNFSGFFIADIVFVSLIIVTINMIINSVAIT